MVLFWRNKRVKKRYPEPADFRKNFINSLVRIGVAFVAHMLLFLLLEANPDTTAQQAAVGAYKGIAYVWFQFKFQLVQIWHILTSADTNWNDAVWVTWATFTTVGYGDLSASTAMGRLVTMSFGTYGIYQFGVFLNSYGNYKDAVQHLKKIFRWRWKDMKDHILVVGLPVYGTEHFIENFLKQIEGYPELAQHEVLFMAENVPENMDSISHRFKNISIAGYRGTGSNDDDLEHCNVRQASMVFVLCSDPTRNDSDDVTAAVVYRIYEDFGFQGHIIAESSTDNRMNFIEKNGAKSVIRVAHYNPGLLVAEALAPGIYEINRDAYQAGGMDTNDYPLTIADTTWVDLASKVLPEGWEFRGYMNGNGEAFGRFKARRHHGDKITDCVKVFIAAPFDEQPTEAEVKRVLLAAPAAAAPAPVQIDD